MHHLPMFAFYLFAFLLVAAVLAVAVFLAFKSGAQGQTKLGGCAGCAIAFALLLIAGLGALGIGFVALVHLPNEALQRGPVAKFHLDFPDQDSTPDSTVPTPPTLPGATPDAPGSPHGPRAGGLQRVKPGEKSLTLVLELRGTDDASKLVQKVRELTDGDDQIRVQERTEADGHRVTSIEITIPLDDEDQRDLEELKQDLKESLPGLKLPKGATVEFKSSDD